MLSILAIDFEEQLNCQKVTLEGKIAGLEAKTEEFESKCVKEKLTIEQQRKDIKLSQTIFQEKEISWEKEKQREKEYLRNYKEELEVGPKKLHFIFFLNL